jgi:putative membrane protein
VLLPCSQHTRGRDRELPPTPRAPRVSLGSGRGAGRTHRVGRLSMVCTGTDSPLEYSDAMPLIVKVALTTLGLWVAVQLVPGLEFDGTFVGLLVVGAILGVINAFARPIVTFFSIPLVLLTLGLFLLIINAMMLGLTVWISDSFDLGLTSTGFWSTFFGAIVVTIVSWIGEALLSGD